MWSSDGSWSPLSLLTRGRGSTNQPIVSGPLHLNSNEAHLGIYESLTSVEATIFLSYSRRWVLLLSLLYSRLSFLSESQFLFVSSSESSSRFLLAPSTIIDNASWFPFLFNSLGVFLVTCFPEWLDYLLLKIYYFHEISR